MACATDCSVDGLVCAAARAAAHVVRDRPDGLPDGLLVYRFGGWFEAGAVSCPTASSQRFSGGLDSRRVRGLARRLARSASAEDSIPDGPGVLPDGSLAVLRWMVRDGPGVLPDGLLAALWWMVQSRRARCLARQLTRLLLHASAKN